MDMLFHEPDTRLASTPLSCNPGGPILHEVEAPDQGVLDEDREAPETRTGRHREAPDAGEGRMSTLDQEFTHGRSQS
jgi:hypothetical protein